MAELNKRTVSASSLDTYLRCPYRYYLTYEAQGERVAPPATPDMLAGTGFHAAIEYALRQVLQGGEPTIDECVAHGLKVVYDEFASSGCVSDPMDASPVSLVDAIATRVKRASTWYLSNQFTRLVPAQVEYEFNIPLPAAGWSLTGRIDCIEADGTVIDHKLSGSQRAPATDRADRSLQLSVYALARLIETGQVPPSLELEYTRDGGSRLGLIVRASTRSRADCERTMLLILAVIESIEAGAYPPANPEGIECNGRCQFWHVCKFGAKGTSAPRECEEEAQDG